MMKRSTPKGPDAPKDCQAVRLRGFSISMTPVARDDDSCVLTRGCGRCGAPRTAHHRLRSAEGLRVWCRHPMLSRRRRCGVNRLRVVRGVDFDKRVVFNGFPQGLSDGFFFGDIA